MCEDFIGDGQLFLFGESRGVYSETFEPDTSSFYCIRNGIWTEISCTFSKLLKVNKHASPYVNVFKWRSNLLRPNPGTNQISIIPQDYSVISFDFEKKSIFAIFERGLKQRNILPYFPVSIMLLFTAKDEAWTSITLLLSIFSSSFQNFKIYPSILLSVL